MALDHYVSQVYLKRFYSTDLGDRMYAIRKRDQHAFTAQAKDVCRIEEGNSNPYLTEERAIEEFLKDIEPNYNRSIDKILANKIDEECIHTISGFIAYLIVCSPAGMRIQAEAMKGLLLGAISDMEAEGKLTPPPPELGKASISELLESGAVELTVDHKYPQAVGITKILHMTALYGNFHWEFLINQEEDSPFFTSDFPVGFEPTRHPRVLNRVIPLTPRLAARVFPQWGLDRKNVDFSLSGFRYRMRRLTRSEVLSINRLIVRCAEKLVFYSKDQPWIGNFVRKNSGYRLETRPREVELEDGNYLIGIVELVEHLE